MPGRLGPRLVGRDLPWRALCETADESARGAGRLLLVTGEAGIGKTALVGALVDRARSSGAVIAAGTGWEGDGAPGYWPWIQVLRELRRVVPAAVWERARTEAGAGLERMLGDRAEQVAADQAFAALDAVSSVLSVVSATAPMVLVLEDLHWADAPSIRLARGVARHTALLPVLLVGTYRSDELAAGDRDCHTAVAELAQSGTEVALGGLDASAVALMLARHADALPPDLAVSMRRRTGGNPFFVEQLAQLWAASGQVHSTPPAVETAIGRRLERLPSGVTDVLLNASLLGTSFDARLVAPDASDWLDEAAQAGLVLREEATAFRWRFTHDLVRETLVASFAPEDRRRRHATIVAALKVTPEAAGTMLATELAHHAASAVPEVPPEEAIALLRRAAMDAGRRLASDESIGHLQRAMALVSAGGSGRHDLVLALAAAQQRAGRLGDARGTLDGALAHARRAGDQDAVAEALVTIHGLGAAITDHNEVEQDLRAALRDLDGGGRTGSERIVSLLLAALSRVRAHLVTDDRSDADRLSAEAVERSRRSGDPAAIASCLLARHDAIWGPGSGTERLALATEMAGAARSAGDLDLELQAALLRSVALLELGDPTMVAALERFLELAEGCGLPHWQYVALSRRATLATLEGRFDDAARWIEEADVLGARLGEPDRFGATSDQSWALARLRGDVGAGERLAADLHANGVPQAITYDFGNALEQDDIEQALRLRDDFDALGARWPRWASAVWLTLQADLACRSGDRDRCETLHAELRPLSGTWAVLAGGVLTFGPVDLWLGSLEAALDRGQEAQARFAAAIGSAERLGARPWVVNARLAAARALLDRGATDDQTAAHDHVVAARDEAVALGMARAVRSADALSVAARGPVSRFALEGDVWALEFAGATVHMADAKGLRDLHQLICSVGQEVPAVALLDPDSRSEAAAAARLGADPILDRQAVEAYRRRITTLDGALDEALERGDDVRAQHLDAERAALIDQLRASTGLGGRPRTLGPDGERARKAVSARVRDTLRRLDERHPPLAEHLRPAVSLGVTCTYQPPSPTKWET